MESILQKEKRCFICGRTGPLDEHHCLSGTSNRDLSTEDGLTIYLCRKCHKLHDTGKFEKEIKGFAQRKWEETQGTREEFIKRYGKSWL